MGTRQTDARPENSAASWRTELAAEYERVRADVRRAIEDDELEEAV